MDDRKKEGQEWTDTPVDKEMNYGENNVEEEEKGVENLGTKQDSTENFSENVEKSVETQEESVEEPVESVEIQEDAVQDDSNIVEETVDNVDKSVEGVENKEASTSKGSGMWWKLILGLIAFAAFLGYCWVATGGGLWKTNDIAVAYAKDNGLYVYDLKNEPYLVNDQISNGGAYNYYFSAWGVDVAEDNGSLYYLAGITEDNVGSLYYKDMKNKAAEAVLVSENVYHYISSADGSVCAYIVQNDDKMDLYLFKDGQSQLIAENILLQNGAYELSQDGSYLVYKIANNDKAALYARVSGEAESVKLSDSVVLDFITEKSNITYYLEEQGDAYQLFQYTPGVEPKLVAEQVTYAELMPNNQDVFYCAMRTDGTSFTQLIEDDITDISKYDEKRQAEIEEMRSKLNGEEGMDPIFQDCYVLTAGGKTKMKDAVISGASLKGNSGFVTGYSIQAPEPVKLSQISSFDEAMYTYYMQLMNGEKEVFIANKGGDVYNLQNKNVDPTSVQVSADGKIAAYFVPDAASGSNVLMAEMLDGKSEAVEVQKNVELIGFLGDSDILLYYYNYNGGMGSLGLYTANTPQEIEQNAAMVDFPEDRDEVYYLADSNTTTGNGTLVKYDGKETKEIDKDVFSFQYKENGKLVYLKNYDFKTGLGDLYYYDGKTTRLLDSGVTAIFMY
ncbi:MAG: hypothetical protein PHG19_04375 [Anaerotignum sp.]|nr:hypothetical protein [Anaerotignum sp.]